MLINTKKRKKQDPFNSIPKLKYDINYRYVPEGHTAVVDLKIPKERVIIFFDRKTTKPYSVLMSYERYMNMQNFLMNLSVQTLDLMKKFTELMEVKDASTQIK